MFSAPEEQDEGVWPELVEALNAFAAVMNQWRVLPVFGGRPQFLGLDYAAAEAGLRLAGIDATPDLWADIQVIEIGAKEAMNGG
ncbi:DUF1799 domain-containing protein [Mameliella alba]|nr:DUF1799 domain-containing protein [Antarctobacter heliothermus]MBY6147255.1 DUF1799 domain-containing protein [Mameliella alba]MCA0957295.1 DUF1799 domain-containing protein [Mameliella alba]